MCIVFYFSKVSEFSLQFEVIGLSANVIGLAVIVIRLPFVLIRSVANMISMAVIVIRFPFDLIGLAQKVLWWSLETPGYKVHEKKSQKLGAS